MRIANNISTFEPTPSFEHISVNYPAVIELLNDPDVGDYLWKLVNAAENVVGPDAVILLPRTGFRMQGQTPSFGFTIDEDIEKPTEGGV
jgi:hypothetical protein